MLFKRCCPMRSRIWAVCRGDWELRCTRVALLNGSWENCWLERSGSASISRVTTLCLLEMLSMGRGSLSTP